MWRSLQTHTHEQLHNVWQDKDSATSQDKEKLKNNATSYLQHYFEIYGDWQRVGGRKQWEKINSASPTCLRQWSWNRFSQTDYGPWAGSARRAPMSPQRCLHCPSHLLCGHSGRQPSTMVENSEKANRLLLCTAGYLRKVFTLNQN